MTWGDQWKLDVSRGALVHPSCLIKKLAQWILLHELERLRVVLPKFVLGNCCYKFCSVKVFSQFIQFSQELISGEAANKLLVFHERFIVVCKRLM